MPLCPSLTAIPLFCLKYNERYNSWQLRDRGHMQSDAILQCMIFRGGVAAKRLVRQEFRLMVV
jgi:hypothetical protein